MAKNFDYLSILAEKVPGFQRLHEYCDIAENFQATYPEVSANSSRKALEWLLKNMLKMKGVEVGATDTVSVLLRRQETYEFIHSDWALNDDIRLVQKIGNAASHDGGEPVKRVKAFRCLRSLYNVVAGFLSRWGAITSVAPFDATLIPQTLGGPTRSTTEEPKVETDVVASVATEKVEHPVGIAIPAESLASEAITRQYLIDYLLIEAGWTVLEQKGAIEGGKACVEVELEGLPTPSGKGYADYVLYARNGSPLAVIEAKAATKSIEEGRNQAIRYADALERKYGVRPVIYYTNGFETRIIDGLGYSDRSLYAFHSMDDLERLIQKRGRAEIIKVEIKEEITNRPYQQTAIKSIIEWLNHKHRRGLLVLATGTGKTRVSISLCDILMNNDWAKNVLFLADRTALVNQAHKNYERLLPSVTMSVLSEERTPNMEARIMFSTYQTMINYIDREDKPFSVGRFDLIIIDEAHRSVFGRYGSIFHYFDALIIGLTATPRDEIDRSTYDLLQLDSGEPNYNYDLEEAVSDGYLIPYETLQYHSDIMERGIAWKDLPASERDQLEEVWSYERELEGIDEAEGYRRDFEPEEIFKYLINTDTIDKVLQELMEKGLKVQSGEEIGKTIIFAMNHCHAEEIVKRFRTLYPEKGEQYCQLIDNYVKYAGALILEFEDPDKMPQIAVSVDMLDTGIDVPSILNLVFFKRVKSKIKFMQMIGRGTRLCPGVFGTKDKEKFYIFDWCNNFAYFSIHADGAEPIAVQSLTERLFTLRLDIAFALQAAKHQEKEIDKALHDELKTMLHAQVDSLSMARIDVREKWAEVEAYRSAEAWTCLSAMDVAKLKSIAILLPRPQENEAAKKFDVLMLQLQLEQVVPLVNADRCRASVMKIAEMLEEKATIPAVKLRMDTIREVQTVHFWEKATIDRLERVRLELREFVHVLEKGRKNRTFVIDIEDSTKQDEEAAKPILRATYKQRVEDFLKAHGDHEVLQRIQHLEQLSAKDIEELERIFWHDLGSRKEYETMNAGKPYSQNVAAFIRVIKGIDHQAALNKYAEFIKGAQLTSKQEVFLKSILDYVSVNGDIQLSDFTKSPLKDYPWRETFGPQFDDLKAFVKEMHNVIYVTA